MKSIMMLILKLLVMAVCIIILSGKFLQSQWIQQETATNKDIFSMYFLNTQTGFAGTFKYPESIYTEILKTTDGGAQWIVIDSIIEFSGNSIHFFNSNTGIISGGFYAADPPMFFRTTNGGLDWTRIPYIFLYGGVYSMIFFDDQNGYSLLDYGIIKTSNAGLVWSPLFLVDTTARNLSFDFININTGWVICDSGRVRKTVDGCLHWMEQSIPTILYMNSIKFVNAMTGFICGRNGLIFKTTNSGANWYNSNSSVTTELNTIHFTQNKIGFIAGDGGLILRTTNLGDSWSVLNTNINSDLFEIAFPDENTGYAGGRNGVIIKTTTGGVIGIEPISTLIPDDYQLYQNYPNPFNPETKIKFSIPKVSFVKISVYDMLGREIEPLVREQLSAGLYEVNWNGTGYSSGAYFYVMSSGEFTSSKKFILTK